MPLSSEREADLRKRASTDVQDLLAELDASRATVAKLREALAYYADSENYQGCCTTSIEFDDGERARDALKENP